MDTVIRYNWHETNIAVFLHKHSLPVFCDEEDIVAFIKRYKDEYLDDYESIIREGRIKGYCDETYQNLYAQKESNAITYDRIIDAISAFQSSRYADAENIVNEILENAKDDLLIRTINGVERWNPTLYRIREHIDKQESEITPKDLFHIPYSARHYVGEGRFSIAGQPCLYLSTCLNIAWKECRMPTSFYYSRYNFDYKKDEDNPWLFLVLAMPQMFREALCAIEGTDKLDFICRYLRTFPIVMACSIICNYPDAKYKPEYVFPQLIMQWVLRHFDKIKGLIYYPCVYDISLRRYTGYNIAIPAVDPDEEGYSKPLLDRFTVDQPQKRSNKLSSEQQKTIASFFTDVAQFSCKQKELSDCDSELYDIAQALFSLSKKVDKIDSDLLTICVQSIRKRIETFFRQYKIQELIKTCREAETYQERYEEEISVFSQLFDRLKMILQLIDDYWLHIEHGIETR